MSTTAINKQDLDKIKEWLDDPNNQIPSGIYDILKRIVSVYLSLNLGFLRAKQTLTELRRAMGIIPKSERGAQINLFSELNELERQVDPEKVAEIKEQRAEVIAQKNRFDAALKKLIKPIGNPLQLEFDLEQANEMMFSYPISGRAGEEEKLRVNRMGEFERETGLIVNFDYPKRVDLKVTVTEIEYTVETVTDPLTGKTIRASTGQEGPENFQITWGAISNLIKMHVGFAIPINRIALMIGQPEFSSSKICRIFNHMANMVLPIYLILAENLSDCGNLSGDDTVTKVLELETEEDDRISARINEHLDWTYPKANGTGDKKALNVSLLVGKTEKDPRSTIRFFRTHRGSVGNLLTKLLEWRNPKSGDLTFQGDMSTTNLPRQDLQKKFNLTIAGCGAHARRPFWKHKDQDGAFCYYILRGFVLLSRIEKIIDAHGRTRKNVLKYRQRYARLIWLAIKNRCIASVTGISPSTGTLSQGVTPNQWPPNTDLYKAANYVINNFKELTLYLDRPEIEYTNNGRERALRIEKCMLNGSKFRKTKGGRAVLDILRTINATCTAAKLDLNLYFAYIASHKNLLKDNPELLTPYAVALALEKSAASKNNDLSQENSLTKMENLHHQV